MPLPSAPAGGAESSGNSASSEDAQAETDDEEEQTEAAESAEASGKESGSQDISDGTMEIKTAEDLAEFRDLVNGGEVTLNAVVTADIDMSGVCSESAGTFEPIEGFEGEFDGGGHTIANFYCVRTDRSAALFKKMYGTVKDLRLENVIVESSEYAAAGIVSELYGQIENCSVSGSVKAYDYAGGIAVDIYDDTMVSGCVNEAEVSGGYYAKGNNRMEGAAAGIAAEVCGAGVISGCTNRGTIIATGHAAGGIAGYCEEWNILIEDCVNEGSILGQGQSSLGEIGSILNEEVVGGIAGYAGENTVVTRCVNNGSVSGSENVGGVVGISANFVINCANHGSLEVSGNGSAAGICKRTEKGLINCYNTGDITCKLYANGIGYTGNSGNTILMNLYHYGTITGTSSDSFSSLRAGSGFMNIYTKENCFVVPDGYDEEDLKAENSAPDADFTGGTILNALNEGVAGIVGGQIDFGGYASLMDEIKANEYFELSEWKAGADGLPCFAWE